MYGNSLQNQTIFKTQLDGPALTVKKLSLFDCSCLLKSYPNITHLYLHYQKCIPHDDDSTLRFISSLSDTLQVLTLRNAGVTSSIFTQAKSGKQIGLPNLRQIEVMLEPFDKDGRDCSLDILRYLSLLVSSVAATPTRNRLRAIVNAGSEPSQTEPVPYADFGLGADSSRLRVPNIPLDQNHWIAWECEHASL